MVKKRMILLCALLVFSLALPYQSYAEEITGGLSLEKYMEMYKEVAIKDPAYTAQLENERKQYGLSARDIQVMNLYYMKFMQFKTWDVAFWQAAAAQGRRAGAGTGGYQAADDHARGIRD